MNPIVTLTLNPCIDQITGSNRIEPDRKLRMDQPQYEPGGGGINVSRAIRRLGGDTCAVYAAGDRIGSKLSELLDEKSVTHRVIGIKGNTRINLNIHVHDSDRLYRFIMPGPEIHEDEINRCQTVLLEEAQQAEYAVISGSMPPGASDTTYAQFTQTLKKRGKRVILDSSGESLRKTLDQGAYLIKPNLRELSEITGEQFGSDRQVEQTSRKLLEDHDVDVILLSLGGGGAMLITHDLAEHIATPTVTLRSKVGAGDSLVAGLTLSLARQWDLIDAARFGVAAGAAAVMTPGTELCRRGDVEKLFEQMTQNMHKEYSRE